MLNVCVCACESFCFICIRQFLYLSVSASLLSLSPSFPLSLPLSSSEYPIITHTFNFKLPFFFSASLPVSLFEFLSPFRLYCLSLYFSFSFSLSLSSPPPFPPIQSYTVYYSSNAFVYRVYFLLQVKSSSLM